MLIIKSCLKAWKTPITVPEHYSLDFTLIIILYIEALLNTCPNINPTQNTKLTIRLYYPEIINVMQIPKLQIKQITLPIVK